MMITDDKLVRNCKLLYSINIGAKVVGMKWLKECVSSKKLLDVDKEHLIVDKEFEKTHGIKLSNLYSSKISSNLLQGHRFILSNNV